ncbi:MAG: endopeptidase La [Terriglobales bacterium]
MATSSNVKPPEFPVMLPALPVRDTVLFPHAVLPLTVGRQSSINLVNSLGEEKLIWVVAQRDAHIDNPQPNDMFQVGTIALVHKIVRMPNQSLFIFTEGVARAKAKHWVQTEPYLRAEVEGLDEQEPAAGTELEALQRNVVGLFQQVVSLSPTLSDELQTLVLSIEEPSRLADFIASSLPSLATKDRQELLEMPSVVDRLEAVNRHLTRELQVQQLRSKIQTEVQDQVQQSQREYYLREQMKAIQKELGEGDENQRDIEDLKQKIESAGMPDEVKTEALRELQRLSRMSPAAADYSVTRNYIEWLAALPWAKSSAGEIDLPKAAAILDEDHYDLEKVKDRILDYLAVRRLHPGMKGPILCFVGPPGVGKTSLGRSIARSLGRKFFRLSLGGVHDEAEVRGHRRTYIGALPGQIIQGLRRAGTNDPVFMLDEVDKIGRDFRGDPTSALLEVLDPEQNFGFRDNYLDVPFDLSKVLFITTANMLDTIPEPLRDRMEIIELSGYTEEEKLHIAFRYLIPKQVEENGVGKDKLSFDEEAVRRIIRNYTREAGVRNLEREVGTVVRKYARRLAERHTEAPLQVTPQVVTEFLGGPKVRVETEIAERTRRPGVAVGLAWTPSGGDVLFIEANKMKGGKGFTMTGHLGQVMQESMQAALTWIRSHAAELGIAEDFFKDHDLHIHVPAGAIPKDGPSAGITMATALASLLTDKPVRAKLAMTGELTLSGDVLPIGGVKEKVLAAKRAGIEHVILPAENRQQVEEDLKPDQLTGIEIHYARRMDEVLKLALPENEFEQHADQREKEAVLEQQSA